MKVAFLQAKFQFLFSLSGFLFPFMLSYELIESSSLLTFTLVLVIDCNS